MLPKEIKTNGPIDGQWAEFRAILEIMYKCGVTPVLTTRDANSLLQYVYYAGARAAMEIVVGIDKPTPPRVVDQFRLVVGELEDFTTQAEAAWQEIEAAGKPS